MFKCCVCNKSSKKSKRDKKHVVDDAKSPIKDSVVIGETNETVKNNLEMANGVKTSPEITNPVKTSPENARSVKTSPENVRGVKMSPENRRDERTTAMDDNSLTNGPTVGFTSPKLGCPYAPAYIERTIADDDGDDSVFEASPGTNESYNDPTPGCEPENREEHLEELVTRLEHITQRLENVPTKFPVQTQETAVQTKTPSPKRIDRVENRGSGESTTIGSVDKTVATSVVSMSVAGYDAVIEGPVSDYLKLSEKIGGDVATHSKLVKKAFDIQQNFIKTASSRPAPTNLTEQVRLLAPMSTTIEEIQDYREKNRGSQFFNHLSAISESVPALGWVAVTPTPAPYVKEMNDAGQFYTNRVLKDWKEKDKTHVEWCKAWVQTLSELQQYVMKNHTTGLVWAKSGSSVPPPPGGMPPPPPPTMPIGDPAAATNDDRSALFAQINQGENITRSLKKVTSDMQTHKNPSIRTGPAPFKAPQAVKNGAGDLPTKTVPPANAPIDKPPVFNRDGKKWLVEYHKGNKDLLVENAEMNNVVYMYRCQDSTMIVKGKINSIVIDSCRKSSIVFDSLVSSIEFVNCQSVQMQVLGKVPTISIDKTDGCQMYLSPESLDVALISSKSSEMNVMVPKGNGDYTEYPVPEQFRTTVSPKGLTTTAVDSLG